jgi:hypothetical protein
MSIMIIIQCYYYYYYYYYFSQEVSNEIFQLDTTEQEEIFNTQPPNESAPDRFTDAGSLFSPTSTFVVSSSNSSVPQGEMLPVPPVGASQDNIFDLFSKFYEQQFDKVSSYYCLVAFVSFYF